MKKWLKKKGGKAAIGSILFLVVGLVIFLVGGHLAGWNIISWLTGPQAILIYVIVGLVMLIGLSVWFKVKINEANPYE